MEDEWYDQLFNEGASLKVFKYRLHRSVYVELNLVNYEICCGFTHMIVTDDLGIDFNTMPLCGAL